MLGPAAFFFTAVLECPVAAGPYGSSRGTMSIRKSNWSDLFSALAMSERDRVRRLFESAMMNAREVISAMKTATCQRRNPTKFGQRYSLSQALQKSMGAITWSDARDELDWVGRHGLTVRSDHLLKWNHGSTSKFGWKFLEYVWDTP